MKLHVLSDLHLGVHRLDPPATDADVTVIAGDLGTPDEAIAWARALERPTVLVPGNHEYHGHSIPGAIGRLRELARGTSVHILADDALVLGGVRFLGTTLWTDFQLYVDPEARVLAMYEAQRLVKDFRAIRRDDHGAPFTPHDAAARFATSARWLEDRLAEPHDGPTVVVSHHAPSPRSIHPRFAESIVNPSFVSDAEHLLDGRKVALWVHGHAHDGFDYDVNGTRVLCNPRGHTRQGAIQNDRFDPCMVVEVG
ncbi:metallophosphoesterase [Candidatus Binatia bacterium]|jgi:Icc-related predicted phosphoesterase|nr:metallophosphoesterase [Candidatus Binatia bacterium]